MFPNGLTHHDEKDGHDEQLETNNDFLALGEAPCLATAIVKRHWCGIYDDHSGSSIARVVDLVKGVVANMTLLLVSGSCCVIQESICDRHDDRCRSLDSWCGISWTIWWRLHWGFVGRKYRGVRRPHASIIG